MDNGQNITTNQGDSSQDPSDFQPGVQAQMGPQTPNTPPFPPGQEAAPPAPPKEPEKKGMGAIFGIIIIIVLIVLAGFYFWGAALNDREAAMMDKGEMTAEEIAAQPDPMLQELNNQNTSDEIVDIETDLNATELNSLDQEVSDIDLQFTF